VFSGIGIFVTNQASVSGGISNSGTISARVEGIFVGSRSAATTIQTFAGGISNSGAILVSNDNGIRVDGVSNFSGNITNSGTVSAAGGFGILVGTTGGANVGISTFTGNIVNSGTISASVQRAVWIDNVSTFIGSVGNSGTISAGINGIQVTSISDFSGSISNGGTISAADRGIYVAAVSTFSGAISNVNGGTISASLQGIWATNIAVFGNASAGGGISNGGVISAGAGGVFVHVVSTFSGGISNSGTISVANRGIFVEVVSTFLGGISNNGRIAAGPTGILVDGVTSFSGGISNSGTITGAVSILATVSGALSIFDSGVIVGTSGTAVDLTQNATGNTFTLGPGYAISGLVKGQGTDTFQLAGTGSGMFNLSNVGTQYAGFTSFNVISATWTAIGTYKQADPWTVQGGTFIVNGNLVSATSLTVNNGGSLEGIGTVGATRINSGGTFAPGTPGAPGTVMTITGNLAFQSGALYLVQVNLASETSANVAGTASLAGNVLAAFAPGSSVQKEYTILHAAGLSGTFAALGTTNLPNNFTASLSYTNTDVVLDLNAALGSGTVLNGNQQSAANAINNVFNGGGTLTPNFLTVFGLSGGNLATALTQLSGEAATDADKAAFAMMTSFLGLMLDPFVDGRNGTGWFGESSAGASSFAAEEQGDFPPHVALAYAGVMKAPPAPAAASFTQRWTAWGSSFGGYNKTDGNATVGSNTVTARDYGFAAGMDYHVTPDTLYGFALAGGGTNWGLAQGLGGGRSDAFQAGLYGKSYFGPAYVAAAFAFTNNWMTTNRFAALGDQLTSRFNAQSYGARLEVGYRYAAQSSIGITPYAALQAQSIHTPSYGETDLTGGGFGLSYNAMTATDTRSELGARFDDLTMLNAMPLELRARAAWAHDWVSNPALDAVFQSLPGASFIVNGATPPQNSALASAGAELHITRNWSMAAKFDGEFASGAQTYAGTGTLRYTW
jgi:uncharacterized protein with beta-barrel porin domain